MLENCRYHTKRIDTIRSYINCLYSLDDGNCCTGGLLHIVVEDGNLEDHHIEWCLKECEEHPEREESEIGKLICKELLKLSMEQRRLVYNLNYIMVYWCEQYHNCCDRCPIHSID